ncbi:hypothetical protein SCB71_09680 [Herbiconiux sp. KACC 21604]|uniref:hypothetical protein n=1 Tax=unclassified Herbiconiux TaxID=2618217 RepID=UPI001490913F|nr:hypothetical protein [Herbiconiux sp. SALV-R1]QJU53512.1 hypothetical protein HL652_07635 [Herbiconiux sp. SALV-R1]WPO88490.1 hypothetical protein SCB71_09680 [Herbiconiux sp. KACC 21604]
MRRSLALTLSAGLLLALAGCSASPAAADCSTAATSGGSSDLVTASGDFGSDPAASFPSPLVPKQLERTVITQGDGAEVGPGSTLDVTYSLYDGETGQSAGAPTTGYIVLSDSLQGDLTDALTCTHVGDRVAVALPNELATQIASGAPGSLVMVFDIENAFPQAADGAPQPGQSGFPSVVHDENGRPGVGINGPAPDEAKSALIKKGDGDQIKDGDQVLVQSTGVSYDTRKVTNSTWETGSPQLWVMSEDASTTQGSSQPAGITPFLVGQTVGSEVLVVLPGSGGGASATAYVVDILGILPAS